MAVFQTRVPDDLAHDFDVVAKSRGKSRYEYLADLVLAATKQLAPSGWEKHEFPKGERLPFNAVVNSREGEDR